jgi:hypothetical protein
MQEPSNAGITPSCWVFVRKTQCIHVSRTRELSITVDGPRRSLASYEFDDEQQLQYFQMKLAEQLCERGWLLCMSASS